MSFVGSDIRWPTTTCCILDDNGKHDRVDAQKLAKLLFLHEAPQVHAPNTDVRQWRMLIQW